MRILVVDDNEQNRYQLQVLLAGEGYAVDAAANGLEALVKARQSPPDLIITDILMPMMDGFSLCHEWKRDERLRSVPLVFYTATYTDEKDRELALNLGAARFIVKPEEPETFLETIKTVIAEQEHGTLAAARNPVEEEAVYLKQYSEALIRKLEGKMQELERANRQLERDLAERQRAEERIREQAALLDQANDAIYVATLDHTILYWNRAAGQIYGWSAAEAVGRKTTDLVSASDSRVAEILAAVVQKGDWSGERRQMTKAGGFVEIMSRVTLLRDDLGQPRSILAINTDITAKKELEARFLRAQRLESIGALASGIAHDLNNVLAPILMGAPLLRDSTKDEAGRRLLAMIEASAQRGADMVRQVLTFVRGTKSLQVSLQPEPLLQDLVRMIGETFPKNIQVAIEATPGVWPAVVDATQLHQALMNLCINARDAMPAGGKLTLAVANTMVDAALAAKSPDGKPGPYVCLRVTDTGTGIPLEVQSRIFEPFFTTKAPGKGTGLGLSTIRGIARSHGGFVRFDSRVGRGTTFELYLPALPSAPVPAQRDSDRPWPHGAGETVLLVDDEAAVCEVARQALKEFGYQVIVCTTGAEAVRVFQQSPRDIRLVVTDMMMPEMDGPKLVSALRAIDPTVRILGITGASDAASASRPPMLTSSALLTKPFTIGDLLTAVHEAMRAAGPRK